MKNGDFSSSRIESFFVDSILDFPRLKKDFFSVKAEELARNLLGKMFVKREDKFLLVGEITEVEAYTGFDDPADHAYRGKTTRNQSLFLDAGHLYVHSIHRYYCLDIVAEEPELPGSVLIRSMRPVQGIEVMQARRKVSKMEELLSGPGKICQAFAIDRRFDGLNLTDPKSNVFLVEAPESQVPEIVCSPRIGISKAQERKLRFCLAGSPFLSR
jgi:DNA-3-methyladenine glycosylase